MPFEKKTSTIKTVLRSTMTSEAIMHYEIKYEGSQEEKDAKALKDLREYMGDKWFNSVVESAKNDHNLTSMAQLRFMFSMGGVTGYPVDAFQRKYLPDLKETD